MAYPSPQPLPEAQRSFIFDQTLTSMVSTGAFRIESRMPTWAVVVSGQPVNHVLHAILTIFMCGLWLPLWLIMANTGGERRRTISVDDWGRVHDSQYVNQSEPVTRPMSPAGRAFLIAFGCLLALLVLLVASGRIA